MSSFLVPLLIALALLVVALRIERGNQRRAAQNRIARRRLDELDAADARRAAELEPLVIPIDTPRSA